MARKATSVFLIVFLLLGVIGLTLVLLPSGEKVNNSVQKRSQVLPGEGEHLDISIKPAEVVLAQEEQSERRRKRPRRPDFRENNVEYEGDRVYDDEEFVKQILFKVNNKDKISLLAADPKPIDWSKPYILLLHDAQEEAKVWDDLGTMKALVDAGYRTRALNLPGRGETTNFQEVSNRGKWLVSVMDDYGLYPFVLVVPSTGSAYGTPFIQQLFEFNNQHALVGVVAVGPTTMPPLAKLDPRPTLLVYGEYDSLYHRDSQRLNKQELDHVTLEVIQGAGHKCWNEDPQHFNSVLVSW
eukprot:CAMPEP_0206188546 /NCGR_PEP_ID=MMETSP0166-20121206/3630_1 /ASSEMBLY_ACC=CAM_ASM_000260 /TAXON_ID=95228 /ORGANISM="Vannella robusta, Strain DIVA3 518/3/11/1/6" /LENGTH=296 /DNA_ID=CAMNT_0053604277 /DNA_START=331 /DNA_END=1218 /DNA_ORIENTATION=+